MIENRKLLFCGRFIVIDLARGSGSVVDYMPQISLLLLSFFLFFDKGDFLLTKIVVMRILGIVFLWLIAAVFL